MNPLLVAVALTVGAPPQFQVENKCQPVTKFEVVNKAAPTSECTNCTVCKSGDCSCFGAGSNCADGKCPISFGKPRTYAEVMARVLKGETLTIELPGSFPDAPPGCTGAFRCKLEDGKPQMRQLGAAIPASPFSIQATPAPIVVGASTSLPVSMPTGLIYTLAPTVGQVGSTNCTGSA